MLTGTFLKNLESYSEKMDEKTKELIILFIVTMPYDFVTPIAELDKDKLCISWIKDEHNYVKMYLQGNGDLRYRVSRSTKEKKVNIKKKKTVFLKNVFPKKLIKEISKLYNLKKDLSPWYES